MATFWKGLFILFLEFIIEVQGSVELFALGFSNGYIQNEQLSASSVYGGNHKEFGAEQARLHIYSGWCGNRTGPLDWYTEWHQVDFREPVTVLGIGLQGSRRNGDFAYYATSFYMQFTNSSVFQNITNSSGETEIFEGINGTIKTTYQWFDTPVSARIFRFRPFSINEGQSSSSRLCARLEYYGYGSSTGKAGCQELYPLGMINGGITDEQLSASSSNSLNEDQTKARLNRDGKLSWSSAGKQYPNEWLQIDLKQQTVVTAIATQGDGYGDVVSDFVVVFGNTTTSLHRIQNASGHDQVFPANTPSTYMIPFLNFLPTPITTRYVRIIPRSTLSKTFCLRLELFGHGAGSSQRIFPFVHPVIQEKSGTVVYRNLTTVPILKTLNTHCLGLPSNELHYLLIQLSTPLLITGIGVQGYPKTDSWVKTLNLSFWDNDTLTWKHQKNLPGGKDSMDIAYHWWSGGLLTSAVKIQPLTWTSQPCLSLQLYGSLGDQNLTALEGSHQRYACPLSRCPNSEVEWFKNRAALNYSRRVLIFDNITRADAGEYYCAERNITTREKPTSYNINVLYIRTPTFNTTDSLTVQEGESLAVICQIESNPKVLPYWLRADGRNLTTSGYLRLTNLTRYGSHSYKCVGSNSGVGYVEKLLGVTINYLDTPRLNVTAHITKREETSLFVTCTVASFPNASIGWVETSGRRIAEGAILALKNISRLDAKNYSCMALHPFIQATFQHFALTVHYMDRPTLNVSNSWLVREGASPTIHCFVDAFPPVNQTWHRGSDNETLSHTPWLSLSLVTRNNSTPYTCRAISNAFGTIEESFSLEVVYLEEPTVNSTLELSIQEGEQIHLTCHVVGYPNASIYWIHENTTIVSNGSSLLLPLMLRSMTGRYTCQARNDFGERRKDIHIVVLYTDCPNIPCQNGGQCKAAKVGNKCECKKSFYGRYCQTGQDILETRLKIKLVGTDTGKLLNKSETEILVGEKGAANYQSITGGIQEQVEMRIKRIGELDQFLLSTEITAVRFSSIDVSLNVYLQKGLNKSVAEFERLLNSSLDATNFTIELSQTPSIVYVAVFEKLQVQDHDECMTGSYYCPESSFCQNTPFSYTCGCMDGYVQRNGTCKAEIAREDSRVLASWIIVIAIVVPLLFVICAVALIHRSNKRQKVHSSKGEFHKN